MASIGVAGKRQRPGLLSRETTWFYILIAPWIIGFFVFTLGPMLASAYFSFTEYDGIRAPVFIGIGNWIRMLTTDTRFWKAVQVTLIYAVTAIPLGLTAGLILALLLNVKVPGIAVWRTIYYMPSVISPVAAAILWFFIFNPQFGLLNWILSWFGIRGPDWLRSTTWALPSLVLMSLWGVGGGMIINLAGLQGIPTELYEAAKVDGANGWKRFWGITLPLMSPVLFYNLVTGIIGTFQYFTQAWVMTGGGPNDATLFYNLYLYKTVWQFNELGLGSAMAWFLLFIVLFLTLLVFKSSALWVYYEGELKKRG